MARRNVTHDRSTQALTRTLKRCVRFEEIDAMGVMWHGRYASWLEDGREDLGRHFGISYLDFYAKNVIVPLRTLNLDFLAPLKYPNSYTLETSLLWSDAAILEFSYIIRSEEQIHCKAYSLQMMLTTDYVLLLDVPIFFQDFKQKWQQGML